VRKEELVNPAAFPPPLQRVGHARSQAASSPRQLRRQDSALPFFFSLFFAFEWKVLVFGGVAGGRRPESGVIFFLAETQGTFFSFLHDAE